jgi:tRNA dimethylallyltransferase
MSTAPKRLLSGLEESHPSGPRNIPLIAIVGPTASGKSALAVRLAQRFGGEVLACDSTQVYRGFDIGTAKPTPEERAGVPHHLLDLVEPSFHFTAGEYRLRALAVLQELRESARLPILTVGTGLYLRALLEGLADAPARSEELRTRLESRAETKNLQYLHRILERLDPESAARIGVRDRPKLIRAIEVCLLTGRPLTELHQAGREKLQGYSPIKIGLSPPRAALYARIEQRVRTMLNRGWLEEVAALVDSGIPSKAKPFDFIGYAELRAHLEGTITLSAATKTITQSTRRYAKRQLTWFRKEPLVHWLEGFGDDAEVMASAEAVVAENSGKAGAS